MGGDSIKGEGFLADDGFCFGCGQKNPIGLRMRVSYGKDSARCEIELDRRFQGWKDVIHGGIVTTLLDEIMAHAVIEHVGQAVTTGIEVRYVLPLRVGQRVVVEGTVDQRRRLIMASARLKDAAQGTILATAKSNFMLLGPKGK